MLTIADDPEFSALRHYAAAIGADPSLVQAAGGNVSLKRGDVLWVKASGTWLAHALQRDIFAPVRLAALRAAIAGGDAAALENLMPFVASELNGSGLRPSIETTLHCVLPHPVVIHVHCVDTIAWACRADAEIALAPLLSGLRWAFIPYVRPGAPLTLDILRRMAPGTDILVLGNHGLVAGGADTASAGATIAEVARRLRRAVRAAPAPDLSALAALAGPQYRPAEDAATHGVATDPAALGLALRGSFYPDHVIFLGPGTVIFPPGGAAPMLVAPGLGVLLRRDASPGVAPLARCLADVCARLDPSEKLVTLTPKDEADLLGWDAEKYRQSMSRA